MKSYPPPLNWHEGLFLTPQHLQQSQRHLDGVAGRLALEAVPFGWGVRTLEIDLSALENMQFKVVSLDAIMEDGTRVRVPDESEVKVRDLREVFQGGRRDLDIFLAIPDYMARSPNVQSHGSMVDEVRRFRVKRETVVDETLGGSHEREIEYRVLQPRILAGDEDRTGYFCLPLAVVTMSDDPEPKPIVHPYWIPPLRRIGANAGLMKEFDGLLSAMMVKAKSLAETVRDRNIYFGSDGGGGDAEVLLKLHVINAQLATFRQWVSVPDVHPYSAYLAIANLIGSLAIFSSERVPPELLPYDHLSLGACFAQGVQMAKIALDAMVPTSWERVEFEKAPDYQLVPLKEDWIGTGARMFIGCESEAEEEHLLKVFQVAKVSAPTRVNTLKVDRIAGIPVAHVPRVPGELPDRPNLRFWQIQLEGDEWFQAREERGIAVDGAGTRELQLALYVVLGGRS